MSEIIKDMEIIKQEEIAYPYLERPLRVYTFDNGYKAILAYKKSPVINISSWVKTGSINENKENNGVSHFVEHLLFKGTNKYKAGVFDKMMERNGGIINAATWKDYTFYYINIPLEHFNLALEMHSDMMTDAIFPPEEIGPEFDPEGTSPEEKRERYVVIEEIRMGEDNNWRKTYKNLNASMYEQHPYKREVIGTKEIIANISQKEIARYYKSFYTPDAITTIIAGDIDSIGGYEETINKIKENFKFKDNSDIEKLSPDKRVIEKKIKNPKTVIDYGDINTAYLMMGALCDSAKNLKETIALDLLSTILGDGKSSRLYKRFIENEKNPYCWQVESCHYQFKEGDNFLIEMNFEADKKDTVIEILKDELNNLKEISQDELQKAKKRMKVNFAHDSEMVADIADMIGHFSTVIEDLYKANQYLEILDEIDTDYLKYMAKTYLKPEDMSCSLLLPNNLN